MFASKLIAQPAGVTRELFSNLAGSSVPDLTNSANYPFNPDAVFLESAFEAPANFADNYGQRMRALVVPPVTGAYTFWICSDDNSVLYLSTDENPANKSVIAYEGAWASWRQWTAHASQKSAPVSLIAGKRYYLEALQKEGSGGDNLSVTWQKPGDAAPADGAPPIPNAYLVAYGLGPPVIRTQPANVSVVESGSATFSVRLAPTVGVTYQWLRGGTPIANATNSSQTISPVSLADNGAQFSCAITNPLGFTNSTSATLTVTADVTRPTLQSVTSLGNAQVVAVIFSEPVEPASATYAGNYTITPGIGVLSAEFSLDARSVLLTTTAMFPGTVYTMTVNNVRDRAATPNTILPNSQLTFRLDATPLDVSYANPAPEALNASSRHGPVVISEIMYHPAARADGKNLEFIELYNSSPFYEDISGYRLSGQIEFTFPTNTVMGSRAYLVLAAVPADIQSMYGGITVMGPYTNKLSNAGGTLRLLNRQGGVLAEVNYSGDPPWPAGADGAGHSLVLAWPSLGERNPAAWSASSRIGGSPGTGEAGGVNPYRSVMINEVLAHTDPPDYDFVELYNYSASPVDLSGCILTDDPTTNKFIFPSNSIIGPQGFIVANENQLGFRLSAAGETVYLIDPANIRILDVFRFGAQENGVSTGRFPDGGKNFSRLLTKTPGTANTAPRISPVVINELMYDPITGNDGDQYVELYNRTAVALDLGKWTLEDAIKYSIPPGTVIPAQGYVVIARNAARLMTNYPGLSGANTLGDFSGSLAHGGEHLALTMPDDITGTNSAGRITTNHIHIVVDEVTYGIGGRWGKWAHGGGSSLELRDARSDHRLAPNWADSDETTKSGWTTIQVTDVLDNGTGTADSLQVFLLGPGECLVDNVEVIVGNGPNLVANSDFESGLSGWVAQGNHEDSSWEAGQGYNSTHCLHVRGTDHGDTGANRIRTTLTSPLSSGQTATIRARVRWLAGCPEILFRLHGSWLEATGNMLTGTSFGTPGAPNSRAAVNVGPAITDVKHTPALPVSGAAVTVSARVNDPDGLAGLYVNFRVDPSTNYTVIPMLNNGAGLYSAVLPAQVSGTLGAFYISALDNNTVRAWSTFPNDAPARECLVRWGDPVQGGYFGTYRLWMTQATLNRWSGREKLSNKPLDCTFVYGPNRIIYNMGAEYSGSPWHAPGFDSPIGNVCDYLLVFSEDDPLLGETAATLQWPGNGGGDNTYQREQAAYWTAEQLGLPYCYRRSVNLFINGIRRAQMFEDVQQPDGDLDKEFYPGAPNGDLHKVQLWFEFEDDASTFTSTGATFGNWLNNRGQKDLAVYRWMFAKRAVQDSANNYTNLFTLVDAANYAGLGTNYRRQLESKLDLNNWLTTYAVEHAVGNSDSFAYGGGQNMYAYKPTGDTWKLLIWDIDFAFFVQPPTSDLFAGIGRSNGIDLGEPGYLRKYYQVLQDLARGPFSGTKLFPILDAKYNAMLANGRTIDSPSVIKDYVNQRRTNILNLVATNVPSSFAITLHGGTGFSTSQNLISLQGLAPIDVRTITINGVAFPLSWSSVTGWVAQVALAPGVNTLWVQGWDASSNAVSGATTSITITNTAIIELAQDRLMINEIMYHPAAPNASFVEIYNSSPFNAFDLSGWKINGVDFTFPGGSVIAPNSYLVTAADSIAFANAYGATIPVVGEFAGTLQNGGETLQLIQPGATPDQDIVIDEVRYDNSPPWPSAADGAGSSLQLIDPSQDNNRVGNWGAVASAPPATGPQWRYIVAPGSASTSTLYIYLQAAGETYVDDIKLVAGTVPESGPNLLPDGDFEAGFPGPWVVSPNLSGSGVSSSIKHGGAKSLHVVASAGGTTRASAIYQDISPPLTTNAPYTLSFWCLENTNGGTLTLRLSNSGIITNVNLLPGSTPAALARATPGLQNSVRTSRPKMPRVWLNEVLPNNVNGATDHLGHHHPWVELYNSSTTNLPLTGMFLANNYTNPLQWAFPAGANINAGQFLLVWLDGNPAESTSTEWHTTFSVPSQSGSLALFWTNSAGTNVLDYLNYQVSQPDRSYGAFPNGSPSKRQTFWYATPGASNNAAAPPLTLLINEWMADNQTTLADPADNDYEDWFELYNPGDLPADPAGFYLGQSLTNRTKFLIPPGYAVPPHGYLLVWADDETSQNSSNRADLHVNFKLSKDGDGIGLFAPEGTVVDFLSFGPQLTDVSEGRFPDGSASIQQLSIPTPRTTNYILLPNTPPTLQAIPNATLFEGQVLIFTALAFDTDSPPQQLTFSLEPGAPAGATINPDSGLFSWRLAPDQVPGTNTITVRVTDDGTPPLSAVTTFTVVSFSRPQVTALQNSGGAYAITFVSVPGKTYQLQYKNSLQDADWLPLGTGTTASGATLTIPDEQPAATQRFYRIIVLE